MDSNKLLKTILSDIKTICEEDEQPNLAEVSGVLIDCLALTGAIFTLGGEEGRRLTSQGYNQMIATRSNKIAKAVFKAFTDSTCSMIAD